MFGLDDVVIGSIIASGVSSVANTALGFMNNEYQKDLQNRMFNREDNSIARRVKDLKAAGLSPVLAAGQGADAGPVVQVKQPEINTDVIQGLQNLLTMQKDFAVKDQQIQTLKSQKHLNDIQTSIKTWDLSKYIESGTASNASGLAKTVRDIFGMYKSPIVDTIKGTLNEKINKPIDKFLRTPVLKSYDFQAIDKMLRKLTPQQREEYRKAHEEEMNKLIKERDKGFFKTLFN